ncbi:MAG: glutamine amidotransferase [Candidatus Omnitrophica bacterium]|nr:glutamine amidotransferase [Candidatus Omnitrophota bacterium]
MKILYAGDSDVGGSANYLLSILNFLKADFLHVPPFRTLKPNVFSKRFDAIVLSDFSRRNLPLPAERAILRQVEKGTGLLMVGGWGSFSGPFGYWHGSGIESILPVHCLGRDDRVNFPSGGLMIPKMKHAALRDVRFEAPPAIMGLNQVRPKKTGLTVLSAQKIRARQKSKRLSYAVTLDKSEYPLLVVDRDPDRKVAALTTDLAPHWCGGLVDWGGSLMTLKVNRTASVQVGYLYVRFVANLLKWLVRT